MEIRELVENVEFKEAAKKVKTIEEAIELCKAYGTDVSGEELVEAIKKSHDEELNAEDLDNVAGGGIVAATYALGFIFGVSPLGALVICGGMAAAGVALAVHDSKKK